MASKNTGDDDQPKAQRVRVFVASPGDVAEERDAVSLVVTEINRILGELLGYAVETVRWETDARPGVGDDPQDVINQQIGTYDIFIGIMWRRFGTPTKRASSGTGEEFERALSSFRKEGRPIIMFYFRDEPFYTTDERELKQFARVAKFQAELRKLGVLYWSYRSPTDFERHVREHLMRQLLTTLPHDGTPNVPALPEPRTAVGTGHARASATVAAVGFAMHSIFLAYSHADVDRVKTLYRELTAVGHRVWMDIEALLPGQMLFQEVAKAIQGSSVFMPVISQRSFRAESGAIKEFDMIRSNQSHRPLVVPVRLDAVPVPDVFSEFGIIDLFSPDGLQRLLDTLQGRAA